MTIVSGRLANIQTLPSTAASIYSNPASVKSYVGGITLHNTNTTNEIVDIHNVPNSGGALGTASAVNRFIRITMAPNDTISYSFPGDGLVLVDPNDSIQAKSTTAGVVTIQLSGPTEI
jgi:hypothetical protein